MDTTESLNTRHEVSQSRSLDLNQKVTGWQRSFRWRTTIITFARAAAHDGSVYILDEATANIDSASERQIQQAMQRILSEKTTIAIAHRLSTIQHAHRILVISQGKVAEQGTHNQLIRFKRYL